MTISFTWDQFIHDNKKFYISEHKKSEVEFKKREQQRKATTRVNIGVFGWNDDAQNFIRQFSPKDGYNITVWDDDVTTIRDVWESTGGKYFMDYARDIYNFVDHLITPEFNNDNIPFGRVSIVILYVPFEKYETELRPLLRAGDVVFSYYTKKCYLLQNDTFDIEVPFNPINYITRED